MANYKFKDFLIDIGRVIPDKQYLSMMFKYKFGKNLNWKSPRTFNEKLQWLKVYDRKDIYTSMVDKYAAKQFVGDIIGQQYIIPTLGLWDNFEEIDFNTLPDKFVLKTTHDSGSVVICKDRKDFDKKNARYIINSSLKRNYYYSYREWPYKNVKPRIIAEEYIENTTSRDLKDYKFFCFNGSVKCFKIDFDRFSSHHANYFDAEGNLLQFGELICPPVFKKNLVLDSCTRNKMEQLACCLSKNIPFLRTDFYVANGKIYFGELTFYPASGFGKFTSNEADNTLGSWLEIDTRLSKGF